jgi:membrane protease YdiL (CAAX protease family)
VDSRSRNKLLQFWGLLAKPLNRTILAASAGYALLLVAFWFVARHFAMEARIHGHMASSFTAFALLLAPSWFFGFGAAEILQRFLTNRALRVLVAGLLLVPYLVYSVPRSEFRWVYAVALFSIPLALAALFEFLPPGGTRPATAKLCWQDVIALAIVGLPVEFGWIGGSFPHPGLSALPKFLLVDSALYAFLVVRRLEGVGYDFRARARDLAIGLRECSYFAPIAIALGIGVGFLAPHGAMTSMSSASVALLITFFFVAIPEEVFFRGLLQNLLEPRIGYPSSLFVAAVIFGLSHFNKPLPFNWRYVLLGTIAGIFYGRAWHDRRRLLSSATTHTLVDVIWSLWFR